MQKELRREIIQRGIVVGLTILLISLCLAVWVGYKIARPIEEITNVVSQISQGELSARVKISATNEFNALGDGINAMTDTIQQSQKALQEKVDLATIELRLTVDKLTQKNIELDKAKNEALSAMRTKAEFLARMSHEIRTPLNAVMGFCHLLEQPVSTSDRKEYIEIINHSANQLHTIIDDILTFSKLESAGLELESREFDLCRCIEGAVLMLRPLADKKKLDFVLLIHQSVPEKWVGDEVRITQIITNLVSNAIKFTREGHVIIEAQLQKTDDSSCLAITVSDTGLGISLDQQKQLFQAFAQADTSITRRYGGTGLGLSISKRLAELMSGDILVESEPDVGSSFTLQLCCDEQNLLVDRSGLPQGLCDHNILIFDSHVISRRSIRNLLLSYGVITYTPPTIQHAVSLISQQSFSAVVVGLSAEENDAWFRHVLSNLRTVWDGPVLCLVAGNRAPKDTTKDDSKVHIAHKPIARHMLYDVIYREMGLSLDTDEPDVPVDVVDMTSLLSGIRLLIVEDNEFNQMLVKDLLSVYGANIDICGSGKEALEATDHCAYDIILMDIHMPDMDGFFVAKSIRFGNGLSKDSPIIALTADVLIDVNTSGENNFFDAVAYKPVDRQLLIDTILENIASHTAESILPASFDLNGSATQADPFEEKVAKEVLRLSELLLPALAANNNKECRSLVHQLMGVIGYFQVSVLDQSSRQLQQHIWDQEYQQAIDKVNDIIHFARSS